jgi:two-component system sensor histidine kinase KdpD
MNRLSRFAPYLYTFIFLGALASLGYAIVPIIGYRAVGFIFLLGVLGVGAVASIGPVLFAATFSALAWNFLFIPPQYTFVIAHTDDLILCLTYFVAALITGVLTSRIRKHQKIGQHAEMLRESEKLHQTLLNSISHELRTPLTTIMGSASALADKNSPDTQEFRMALARELTGASDRLNRVIENLLDMSRISSGVMRLKKEWHDIHDLIGVTLQRLGQNLEHHTVKVVVPPELPLVEIDFLLLEHVLTNVILNAVQYSPNGTLIKISSLVKDGRISILVEDDGPGIAEPHLSKVFEKFYRIPGTPAGGTGLGLSIAKSIVELHGGSIRAENCPGGGSRFVISLPLSRAPDAPKERDAASFSH